MVTKQKTQMVREKVLEAIKDGGPGCQLTPFRSMTKPLWR